METELKIKVIQVLTDGAANCRKARRLLVARRPDIQDGDCSAHLINLLVGDIIKGVDKAADDLKACAAAISWINRHTIVHAIYQVIFGGASCPIAVHEADLQVDAGLQTSVLTVGHSTYTGHVQGALQQNAGAGGCGGDALELAAVHGGAHPGGT